MNNVKGRLGCDSILQLGNLPFKPARLQSILLNLFCWVALGLGSRNAFGDHSVAREWDERILQNIRTDSPNPPVHARNLFHLSICMYDAWAAYDPVAVGYIYRGKQSASDVSAARREAISYAAWRILKERYVYSRTAAETLAAIDAKLVSLGYDTNNHSMDPSTPAGLGNLIAATVSQYYLNDGSLQTNAFIDTSYLPFNPPMATGQPGTPLIDSPPASGVNRWQPLSLTNAVDQNGFPQAPVQTFVGSQWLWVQPFSLERTNSSVPWINPGPQPKLAGVGDSQFRADIIELITKNSYMIHGDTNLVDVSPGIYGNNSLGANDGTGHPINPYTGQPYASNIVRRGDWARVMAEFWADGPQSETPPGHWNVLANYVSDHPMTIKRIGGLGPVLDDLEWDVKLYFALNAAVHDAACVAWGLKRYYDGGRPISYIRYMAQKGQSTNPSGPRYHVNGLPLIPGLIEQVTQLTALPGQRHAGLPVNEIAVLAWSGPLSNPTNNFAGVKWIRGDFWMPFQRGTFVTPAFPGYVSGHSTFSRSGAEILTAFTGTNFFPGGLGVFTAEATNYLTIELGPSQTTQLQYATYYDASDQAGQSRIYGGIHPTSDDFPGRIAGSQVGKNVWALATKYFDGSILGEPMMLSFRPTFPGQCEIQYPTLRGFNYCVQSTPSLALPFTNEPSGFFRATDTLATSISAFAAPSRFYRVVRQ